MSISLSKEHGVNPAIPNCYYCDEKKNEVILAGHMRGDIEAPKNSVWDMTPCEECLGFMQQGIIMISVRDGEMDKEEEARKRALADWDISHGHRSLAAQRRNPFRYFPNPHRSGNFVVVTEDFIRRAIGAAGLRTQILSQRWSFVPDEVWLALGLPTEHEGED